MTGTLLMLLAKLLGRLATEITRRLRGKHNFLILLTLTLAIISVVINAEEIQVTGKKALDKITIATLASLVVSVD